MGCPPMSSPVRAVVEERRGVSVGGLEKEIELASGCQPKDHLHWDGSQAGQCKAADNYFVLKRWIEQKMVPGVEPSGQDGQDHVCWHPISCTGQLLKHSTLLGERESLEDCRLVAPYFRFWAQDPLRTCTTEMFAFQIHLLGPCPKSQDAPLMIF